VLRLLGLAALVLATAAPAGLLDDPIPAEAAFQLGDGSAGCRLLSSGELACRASGVDAVTVLTPDGDSRPATAEVWWDRSTPVLLPAESWWHAGFTCRAPDGTILCTAGDGAISAGEGGVGGVR
jgi:hypothetical protein